MANIVNTDRVSKGYGGAGLLLDEVSLGLDENDRVGVVGLNGAGKSTLLRLLTRAEEPDSGRVTHRRDLRALALPQQLDLAAAATVRDVVVGDAWLPGAFAAEHEWAGDAGIRAVLAGLGMAGLGLDSPVGPMSGGERRRVALAALLVRGSDLLVLDEPTNHLDLAGVNWLAGYLLARRGALVVVTHDRWFLDAVTTSTWEVADQTVRGYEGGYAAWVLARLSTARLGKQVYELRGVDLYAGPKPILSTVDWIVGPGDRIALLGANGAGKTTLLRLLAGLATPAAGTLVTGSTVRSAYLSQELAELPGHLRLLEAVEEVATRVRLGERELSAAQLAEVFGFTDRRVWTPVADLSGGERRRLQLLRLLATEPNVLLLDEPTNDLDTDTLAALEDLLDTWPGTLVLASHDRYLVERVTDEVYGLFGDGTLTHLPGGVDGYLARLSGTGDPVPAGPAVAAAPGRVPRPEAEIRAARRELQRLERQVDRYTELVAGLHQRLAEHATDYAKVAALDEELRQTQQRQGEAEDAWLALAERLGEG